MSSEHPDLSADATVASPPLKPDAKENKKNVTVIAALWLVLTAIGIALSIWLTSALLPSSMSTEMGGVRSTVLVFSLAAAPVVAFVLATSIYSLLAWRKAPGSADVPPPDAPPLRGNAAATGIWLLTSSVLVVFLLVWGLSEWSAQQVVQPNDLVVKVTGQQWIWNFTYPDAKVDSHALVVPLGRQVQFNVTSLDVTHGFWPVQLGQQVDANPGLVTTIRVTPTHLGHFVVRCSQLCGLYHAYMYAQGDVVTAKAFEQFLEHHGASAATSAKVALLAARQGGQ